MVEKFRKIRLRYFSRKDRKLSTPAVLFLLLLLIPGSFYPQPINRKALFLGNSYTYVNNLPGLVAALAHFAGDSLFFGSNTPGGYTLGWQPIAHATDPVSLAKIHEQSWDFVVLQEQSQIPAIPILRDSCMIPGSQSLFDSVKSVNPCSRVLFYLTWGRRYGGIQCFVPNYCSPNFTDFNQMQDSLTMAYKMVADSLSSWIAPVGVAWRLVIGTTGMVLHDADDSHPNLKGSYLAACVFYAVIFGKHSHGIAYTAGLSPDTANILQQAADSITFGYAAHWNLNNDIPGAAFIPTLSSGTLYTQNLSTGAGSWFWDFGDGQTSTLFEPVHVYSASGSFPVRLRACNSCFCDSVTHPVVVTGVGIQTPVNEPADITPVGPDESGIITLLNFPGDGTLFLYSAKGECTGIYPVHSGKTLVPLIEHGMWLWKLSTRDSKIAAAGKIVR
ncbi:MAG: PKD domain-containing protein [Bacteroidota bacterium]